MPDFKTKIDTDLKSSKAEIWRNFDETLGIG